MRRACCFIRILIWQVCTPLPFNCWVISGCLWVSWCWPSHQCFIWPWGPTSPSQDHWQTRRSPGSWSVSTSLRRSWPSLAASLGNCRMWKSGKTLYYILRLKLLFLNEPLHNIYLWLFMYIMVRSQVCRGFRSTVSRIWPYLLRLCVYFHLRLEEVPTHHDGRRTRWQEHHWEGCLQICDPASEGASGNLLARAGWRLHGKLLLHYVACQNMAKWLASWQVYTSLHFLLKKAAYICWCDFAYPQAINAKESKGFKRDILAHIIVMSCVFWILWLDIVVSGCIWLFYAFLT